MRNSFHIAVLILVLVSALGGASAQEESIARVAILADPVFDQQTGMIRVDLVVRNADGSIPGDLTGADFTLDAPVSDLQAGGDARLPLALAIIVDTSKYSDIDLIRDTLLAYFEHYYRPDDLVTLYIVNPEDPRYRRFRKVTIGSKAEAEDVINGLRNGETYFMMQPALETALSDLEELGATLERPRQALFVGTFLNRPSEAEVGTSFAEAGIPLHVVQAHRLHIEMTGAYRQLARNGNGLFADNKDGLFVLPENYEPVNLLKVLYDAIASSRLVYTLQFRPTSISVTRPQQEIGVTVALPDGTQAQTRFQYTLDLLPPTVAFADPEEAQVRLEPVVEDGGVLTFQQDSRLITVQVAFPDHITRPLRQLTLTVTDLIGGEPPQTVRLLNPEPAPDGTIQITWPLEPFKRLEDSTLSFAVEVVDETGLTGSASMDGSIQVPVVPAAEVVIPPTLVPTPSPAEKAPGLSLNPFALVRGIEDNNITQILLSANIIILLLAFLFAVLALLRRKPAAAPAPVASPAATTVPVPAASLPPQTPSQPNGAHDTDPGLVPVEQQESGSRTTYAQLLVNEGLDKVGQRQFLIQNVRYVIGRASTCDLVINQPYISPEHCLINWHNGRLYVRDLDSKNGTYVNGERVLPESEVDAPIGSEIGVTKNISLELHRSDYELLPEEEVVAGSTVHSTVASDEVGFKRLPGLRYAPDQGSQIDDNYSPI